ncbi:sialidase-3-like isoform X2 [Cheilinus undulatus]|nr:sialidase-3-like isoform X2 [Cheilinus undulatus]
MKMGKVKTEVPSSAMTIEWSELNPVEKAHIEGYRPMNPCPLFEKTSKTLFLFFICVEGTVTEQWQIDHYTNKTRLCYIKSTDLGQSWSDVTDLTDELHEIKSWATFAVGPGHGIQTESGRLIVPVYAYMSCCSSCCLWCAACVKVIPYALTLYSDDSGDRWQFGPTLDNESLECEMAEFINDKKTSIIYCNARTRGGYRQEAVSSDASLIFKPSSAMQLVETGGGCQGSVVSFPAQNEGAESQNPNKWLLYSHPSNQFNRIDLGIYLNKVQSDSRAWRKPWIINSGPSGYSDLAYIDDGCFVCLMERGKDKETEEIASAVFSYNEFKQGIRE